MKEQLKELLPDALGDILLGFFTLLTNMIENPGIDKAEQLQPMKAGLRDIFSGMFKKADDSSESSDEEGIISEDEEMEINSTNQQANDKWNPKKGRHGWRTTH